MRKRRSVDPQGYLTTGQAARLTGFSVATVHRWMERGLLRAHRVGDRAYWRILARDLVVLLESSGVPIPDELRAPPGGNMP